MHRQLFFTTRCAGGRRVHREDILQNDLGQNNYTHSLLFLHSLQIIDNFHAPELFVYLVCFVVDIISHATPLSSQRTSP